MSRGFWDTSPRPAPTAGEWKQIEENVLHVRFVGATVYCAKAGHRLKLDPEHKINAAFDCPGCARHIPARPS